jgi:hypothetical protein
MNRNYPSFQFSLRGLAVAFVLFAIPFAVYHAKPHGFGPIGELLFVVLLFVPIPFAIGCLFHRPIHGLLYGFAALGMAAIAAYLFRR